MPQTFMTKNFIFVLIKPLNKHVYKNHKENQSMSTIIQKYITIKKNQKIKVFAM